MNIHEYTQRVARLAAPITDEVRARHTVRVQARLNELQEDLFKTVGEIDTLKKYIFYGKNADQMGHYSGPQVDTNLEILHAQLGVITEGAELWEITDPKLLTEEIGDQTWYICYLLHTLQIDPEKVFDLNIEKLEKKRYKNGFTPQAAIERDTDAEAKVFGLDAHQKSVFD
jgi:hypothetical protein